MHRVFRQIATLALFATFALGLAACGAKTPAGGKDVAATVNGKEITLSDVDRLINQQTNGQRLLDYREYAQAKGIKYDCFSDHAITVQELEDVAKHQGTEFRHGDIVIVRTGFTDDLGAAHRRATLRYSGSHFNEFTGEYSPTPTQSNDLSDFGTDRVTLDNGRALKTGYAFHQAKRGSTQSGDYDAPN